MSIDQKIKEHEEAIKALKLEQDSEVEWVKIGYKQIPKSLFVKYGLQPFEIQKRKMRKDGKVWNEINFFDAQKEAKKLGYRLPDMREMLMLLEFYKQNKEISNKDKEFLGIEELSYDENVCYEWTESSGVAFLRGGNWASGAGAGVFALNLDNAPSYSDDPVGFRCAR
jgi:formylglycine-generating enzyme required for sulfatase activity